MKFKVLVVMNAPKDAKAKAIVALVKAALERGMDTVEAEEQTAVLGSVKLVKE